MRPEAFNKFENNTKDKIIRFYKKDIEDLNIGELFIQNIDKDGSQNGYDTDTIQKVVKDTFFTSNSLFRRWYGRGLYRSSKN